MPDVIDSFRGEYRFLSNHYPSDIDMSYVWQPRITFKMPTAEHAFQSLKAIHSGLEDSEKMVWLWRIVGLTDPADAKHYGSKGMIEINPIQWDRMSEYYMGRVQQQKYLQNPELADRLIATGDAALIEGNTWGDRIWGQVDGVGENKLGHVLMQVRAQLVAQRAVDKDAQSVVN